MTYDKNEDLPAVVRSTLSAKEQSRFRHVYNAFDTSGKDEATALLMANGAIKGQKSLEDEEALAGEIREVTLEDGTKSYQYVSSYEYEMRQFTQSEANYTPVGGGSTRACSNCRWFVSPSRCTLVMGDIAPNGISDLWAAIPTFEMQPIPVVIVGGDKENDNLGVPRSESDETQKKSIVGRVIDWLGTAKKSLIGGATLGGVQSPAMDLTLTKAFSVKELDDGSLRWFAQMSNNFTDREGETFTEASHKEFVDWAEKTGSYPELWLWHIPGSKFGTTDWMDVTSGFVCASGLIDDTVEAKTLAKSLAESGEELGTSHGFVCLKTKDGTIVKYRSKELSALPLERAANGWTAYHFNLLGDSEMPFSEARKSFLQTKGVSTDQITAWEQNTDALSAALRSAGVSFKSIMEDAEGEIEMTTEVAGMTKAFGDFVSATNAKIAGLEKLVGEAKELATKSRDEIISDEYLAKVAAHVGGKSFSASTDATTAVTSSDASIVQGEKGKDWMEDTVWNKIGFGQNVPTS